MRGVITGAPGERYRNDTERPVWQFVADLANTCGLCLQYHHAVGHWWPIPLHINCRCTQVRVPPGQLAPHAFVDFQHVLAEMPASQQTAAIGRACYQLLERGVIEWRDVVTPSRVRTLEEVVARKRLTVDALEKAGVRPGTARRAWDAVHTQAHASAEQGRREAAASLLLAGADQKHLARALASEVGKRVGMPVIPGAAASTAPSAVQASSERMLAKVLARWRRGGGGGGTAAAPVATPRKRPPNQSPSVQGTPADRFPTLDSIHAWAQSAMPGATVDLGGLPLSRWQAIAAELEHLSSAYPDVLKSLKRVGVDEAYFDARRGAIAATGKHGDELVFSHRYWTPQERLEQAIVLGSREGWLPPAAAANPTRYAVSHEFGHLLHTRLEAAQPRAARALERVFTNRRGRFDAGLAGSVSGQAASGLIEAIADAFAVVRLRPASIMTPATKSFLAVLETLR